MYRIVYLSLLALSGCASAAVNYNALDIASTYDTLLVKQVAFNLIKTLQDQYSIPAYARIATQTAQTTDGFNPTFSVPFTPQSTLMQTAAAVLTGKNLQTAGSGLSLQLQANRQQNYTLSPVGDPDQLRRLRSIYQYAAGKINDFEFEADYPIISVSATAPAANAAASKTTVVTRTEAGELSVTIGGGADPKKAEPTFVRRACDREGVDNLGRCTAYHFIVVKPDKTFIQPPGCIMCDFGTPLRGRKNVYLLTKNPKLAGHTCNDKYYDEKTPCVNENPYTMFYTPGEKVGIDAIPVPFGPVSELNLRGAAGLQAFYELVLFTQEASSQGTGSPSTGGQSDGRKTPALQTISGPGATVTNIQ